MNREELLAVRECEVRAVPAGDRTYYVRSISASEMVDFEASIKIGGDTKENMAVQLATFVSNEHGNPVLSAEDAKQLCAQLKASTVQAIISAAMSLNALGAKDKEAIQGNS